MAALKCKQQNIHQSKSKKNMIYDGVKEQLSILKEEIIPIVQINQEIIKKNQKIEQRLDQFVKMLHTIEQKVDSLSRKQSAKAFNLNKKKELAPMVSKQISSLCLILAILVVHFTFFYF